MKNLKKLTALFLALLMIASTAVAITITSSADTAITVADYDKEWYEAAKAVAIVKQATGVETTNESIAIADVYDLLAYNQLCTEDGDLVTCLNVHLTADIDMTNVTWDHSKVEIGGTFDGRGHKIKNYTWSGSTSVGFFDYVHNLAVVKDIVFENVNVTSTTYPIAAVSRATNGIATFENVYVTGTVNGGTKGAGGLVGQVAGGTTKFINCVSDVDVAAKQGYAGGFVGIQNMAAAIQATDCAFIGSVSTGTTASLLNESGSAGFVARYIYGTAADGTTSSFTRCVVLGKGDADTAKYAPLFYLNNGTTATNQNITVTDCYVVSPNGSVIGATSTTAQHNLTFKFGDTTVATVASGTKTADKLADINAAFAANGGYLVNGETVNVTADNFGDKCAALAKAGWVVTGETTDYAEGKTIAKMLPASAATMLGKTALTAPNATSYLQIKNGTDGKYDVRFIGAVNADDLAAYETVGFVVVVKLNGTAILTDTVETKAVYTSIKADGVDVTAETLGADYLNVLQIAGFKAENAYDISVLSFAKRANGTVVYDYAGALEVTVQNAAVAQ